METLTKLAQQMSHIEQKLDTKADTATVSTVEEMVKGLETKICVQYNATVKSLEKQMSREMQDIRATMTGEYQKRSHNIHGLKEIPDEDGETRKKADEDHLEQLFHAIQCDDVLH